MKTTSILFAILGGLIMPGQTFAQQRMMLDSNSAVIINELGAIITIEGEELVVMRQMNREDAEPGVDRLEQGDVILMMNGTRVKDIAALREVYDGLAKDEQIKVGVRRGEQRFIVSGVKGDVPETSGGRMVMRMETDGDGTPPVVVPEVGVVLGDREGAVVINAVIQPLLPEALKETDLKEYTITMVNGKKPENAEALKAMLAELEIGAEIDITFSKDGEEKSFKFNKPEPRGNFSFSIDNE